MSKVYHSRAISGGPPRTVVVHCSDPRYQPHFQEFLRQGLGITHYALVAVPGGTHFLSKLEGDPATRAGIKWVDFVTKLIEADHCVLIGHADCRWYLDNRIERDPQNLKPTQAGHMGKVRARIRKKFPNVRVELYYATMQGSEVLFEPVHVPD